MQSATAQYTAIPDANFEQALFDLGIDIVNGDHQVETSAIYGVTSLDVSSKGITNLYGIRGFFSLQTLNCSSNQLQYLDLSGLMFLSSLNCSSNQLYVNNFNVSNYTSLSYLDCSSNQLTSIDVSPNTALTYLDCGSNQLSGLDVSANTALTYLDCASNQLTIIDVSANIALTHFNCMFNQLTSLFGLPNTLNYLDCSNNQISQFGYYYLQQLTYLNCSHNQLTFIETNWFGINLSYFNCSYNQLTNLYVAGLINLTDLICTNNQLTGLNVWGLNKLTSLFCEDNQISVFNDNWNGFLTPNLQYFTCFNNQLTSLNISSLNKLIALFCYNNQITSINASNLPYLNQFWCWSNQLTALNVSGDSNLNQFWSYNNPNLSCIQVSDVAAAYSNTRWYEDSTVTYSLNCNLPTAPITNAQSFCAGATVANLVATGISLQWYYATTGGIALANTTILATGTYYVSQIVGGVESARTAVNITVNPIVTPTFVTVASSCANATLTALPTTSTNGISGTWSPVLDNTETTIYTFTPTVGQCATTTTQTITISNPLVTSPISFVAPVITIGTQVWTYKDLDITTYRDGTPIPQVTDPTAWAALTTGAWCYYNNDPANGAIYGKLYNWYAVAGIHDNDPNTPNKILALEGWHVPTDAEWTVLTDYLGGTSVAGGKMKSTGTSLWQSPNTAATNESGFTGVPGDYRNTNGAFGNNIGPYVTWWSSSENNTSTAWVRFLYYLNGNAYRNIYSKLRGYSVRLIKD